MLDAVSHVGVWVHDQEEAKAFYTEKLGFEVRQDVTLDELGQSDGRGAPGLSLAHRRAPRPARRQPDPQQAGAARP